MTVEINKPKFEINSEVYHISPGSGKGIILDVSYSFRLKQFRYRVTFGIGIDDWYDEEEIDKTKRK